MIRIPSSPLKICPPQAKPQYRMAQEFVERAGLEALALDLDLMRTQSLLICERILGTVHKDMIYRWAVIVML